MYQWIDFGTRFVARCTARPRGSNKLTVGKEYIVTQIGFNGHFRIWTDSGRYSWYDPKYFFSDDPRRPNFQGVGKGYCRPWAKNDGFHRRHWQVEGKTGKWVVKKRYSPRKPSPRASLPSWC